MLNLCSSVRFYIHAPLCRWPGNDPRKVSQSHLALYTKSHIPQGPHTPTSSGPPFYTSSVSSDSIRVISPNFSTHAALVFMIIQFITGPGRILFSLIKLPIERLLPSTRFVNLSYSLPPDSAAHFGLSFNCC